MSKNFIARTKPRDDDDDIESSSVRACVSLFYVVFYVFCGKCGKSSRPFSVVLSTFTTNLHARKRLIVEEIETLASSSITINPYSI